MFQQLELDFAAVLASALEEPEQADISLICATLDQYLEGRSQHEQLRVAGEAIRDIAEVCSQRAQMLIQDWQERYNTEGPVLDEDFLAGMVQETMHLDISDLCRQPKRQKKLQGFTGLPMESIVGEVGKDAVLEFVDQIEERTATEVALKASHEEDVGAWVGEIREYLEEVEGTVSFAELVTKLEMPMVVVWLGILLGGFDVEQRGGFYGDGVWVGLGG
ncbi:MAG: hypothetical protein HC936_01480 [Leptolyngbyaceae cyanobacterium SU_3_3]|nr:hypothetical protein [Leptolyngbyaceae cyanobacterium SU_3_3]